ncbi:MAG TPA: hypothetical protein VK272_01720 [Solirubrobacteraceae bacterium]|nr:hypothetical protein [Solirubrobacteraceae bacterium]
MPPTGDASPELAKAASAAHFKARRLSLQEDLERARAAIDGLDCWGTTLARPQEMKLLSRRLTPIFEQGFHGFPERIAETDATFASDPGGAWSELEQLTRELVSRISDTLTLVEGAFLRASGFDNGLCRTADCLLDEIAQQARIHWQRTVLPAEREQARPGAWLIGWRFPDFSIWSLPLMAHELGHYAVDELEDWNRERLARKLLDGGWTEAEELRALVSPTELEELFADAFGAFVLGPAYVACLMWRASPARV